MKHIVLSLIVAVACSLATSCSPKYAASATHADKRITDERIRAYDELTMDLDPRGPVEYTIDISTAEGRLKLNGLSLEEAKKLALIEAIMRARCVAMFEPQYTHKVQKNKVLRVTVYGTPAHYKKKS